MLLLDSLILRFENMTQITRLQCLFNSLIMNKTTCYHGIEGPQNGIRSSQPRISVYIGSPQLVSFRNRLDNKATSLEGRDSSA